MQRGDRTDARKRHKFPKGEREMLKEIKIIPVMVIKKVECWKTGKKRIKKCRNKHDISQNLRERGRHTAETLRTWKALGRKPYVPAEIWHCATIWLKLNSGCGCHPASWYFCFKDLFAVKEILLAIKRPVVFASFLLARFPFYHLLFGKIACEGIFPRSCVATVLPNNISQIPRCGCSTGYHSQCAFIPLNWGFWTVLEKRGQNKDIGNPH